MSTYFKKAFGKSLLRSESLFPPVEWSTKLNVRVMEPDPNSENIAAITQSSVGSDCKYTRFFDRRNLLT